MKCPRCRTENDNQRTICTKCGFYLYRNSSTPRSRMTKAQVAELDRKLMWARIRKILKWAWRILVIIVITYWIVALFVILASGAGVSLFNMS